MVFRTLQPRNAATAMIIAAVGLYLPTYARAGDYRLRPGDTIEFSVAGVPELKQRLTLDLDGQIALPLVGVLSASGSTVAELGEKLQHLLPTKALRMPGTDGQEVQRVIEANDIAVNIVEYSPVYINGDVVRPGEQRFRPELTVREAVALAGGYEVMRYHLVDPVIQSADLQADYETLWTEQAREQARLARLKAELSDKTDIGEAAATGGPVSRQLGNDLANNETQQLSLWHADHTKEIAFLTRAIKSATDQLAELDEQRDKEKEGAESDFAELQRLTTFNKQGDVTSNRVVEARRSTLLSSTRVLQTEAQIIQISREKEDYLRRIEKLNDEFKSDILKEIEESEIRLQAINARISATADKLVYTSTMRSQFPLGRAAGPSVAVFRGSNQARTRIDATEDTQLEPGDVIEISLIPKSNGAENKPVN